MLLKLFIENYALIQKLEIDWSDGLSVITGETGAGKSILVGAMSLILGQRADTSVLFNKEAKCIVEGVFTITGYGLNLYFDEQELDYDDTLVLRREISPTGKSRAFINDTPVSINQLRELGDRLVNIHSQHSVTTLNQADFQLEVLDDYGSLLPQVTGYREKYHHQKRRKAELQALNQREAQLRGDTDYLSFLFEELDKAMLVEGEQSELEESLAMLTHAEEIRSGISRSTLLLEGSDANILSGLNDAISALKTVSSFHPEVAEALNRLESNLIDIKDITKELQRLEDRIQVDPQESDRISARLDLIYRMQKKHQVSSVADLISLKDELSVKLSENDSLEDRITRLSKEIEVYENELVTLAESISAQRRQAIPDFEREVDSLLNDLGMPSARFSISCVKEESLSPDGIDRVTFLFTANKGVPQAEVSKVASGGELSRLMLSIKSMISRKNLLPTVIFDEIDSGVSGDIAGKVGTILKRMAEKMQVIVITHLPQIAGKGGAHYWVFKEVENGTTRSRIKKLTQDERVEEIAKMVSSDRLTEASYQTAKELLIN